MPRSRLLALLSVLSLLGSGGAEAQVGSLIKKKVSQVTGQAQQPAGEPVVFTNVILEITADRVNKLLAAKQAAKPLAEGAGGPAAIQARIAQVGTRQSGIYEKEVEAINEWDEKRRDHERCVADAIVALQDQRGPTLPDPATMTQLAQLAQALAAAQARGDTAEVRRIAEAVDKLKAKSTRADSLAAEKQCGKAPAPSGLVKEYLDAFKVLDTLAQRLRASEDTIRATEERVSGMNAQQMAMLCERIHMYNTLLKEKKQPKGYTAQELQTLANLAQAIKDLGALCP